MRLCEKELINKYITKEINQTNALDLGCGPRNAEGENCDKQEFTGVLLGVDCNKTNEPDLCCNILDIDKHFKEGSIKLATLIHTLEDMQDPYECLRKIIRVLDKDGILIIICPTRNKYPRCGTNGANGGHKYDFEVQDVEYILWKCMMQRKSNYEILSSGELNSDVSFEVVVKKSHKFIDYSKWGSRKMYLDDGSE